MNVKPAAAPARSGLLEAGIAILGVATGLIHIVLAVVSADPVFTPLFILNGLGYLVLVAALYLPLPFASQNRGMVRWALMGLAAITILAWLIIGDKSLPQGLLGYITKVIELALIVLLFVNRRS